MEETFGDWLRRSRKAVGITQKTLAERVSSRGASVTLGYISNLERNYYPPKSGETNRPRMQIVDALADALEVPRDEARLAAGYAPETTGPPQTVADLLKAIERLGVEGIMFHDEEKLHELDAEQSKPESDN